MEVYTWGNNRNFTLGHGGQQGKHHPELVDLFPRNGMYIKQVFLMSYIGTFLSELGGTCEGEQVWKMLSGFENLHGKKKDASVGFLLCLVLVFCSSQPPSLSFFLVVSQQAVSVNLASSLKQLRSSRVGLLYYILAPQ